MLAGTDDKSVLAIDTFVMYNKRKTKEKKKMKNAKLYNEKRYEHENAYELSEYEHYNGISFYPCYNVSSDELKNLRQNNKSDIKNHNAFKLDGFNDRALVYPTISGYALKSYNTIVCRYENGEFIKTWYGFSNTTLKHINIFREFLGLEPLSKYEWIMMG